MKRCCKTCFYWVAGHQTIGIDELNECRIAPPAISDSGRGVWPITHEDDVCGEWKADGDR